MQYCRGWPHTVWRVKKSNPVQVAVSSIFWRLEYAHHENRDDDRAVGRGRWGEGVLYILCSACSTSDTSQSNDGLYGRRSYGSEWEDNEQILLRRDSSISFAKCTRRSYDAATSDLLISLSLSLSLSNRLTKKGSSRVWPMMNTLKRASWVAICLKVVSITEHHLVDLKFKKIVYIFSLLCMLRLLNDTAAASEARSALFGSVGRYVANRAHLFVVIGAHPSILFSIDAWSQP